MEEVETKTLQGELGVQLSTKPEANKPFSSTFDFIGAAFDVSNLEGLRRRPADHILERLGEQSSPLLAAGPQLWSM